MKRNQWACKQYGVEGDVNGWPVVVSEYRRDVIMRLAAEALTARGSVGVTVAHLYLQLPRDWTEAVDAPKLELFAACERALEASAGAPRWIWR